MTAAVDELSVHIVVHAEGRMTVEAIFLELLWVEIHMVNRYRERCIWYRRSVGADRRMQCVVDCVVYEGRARCNDFDIDLRPVILKDPC